MADNETTADIIAEIRAIVNEKRRANDPWEYEASISLKDFTDRLEAAHKREVRETEDLFRKSLKKQEDTLRDQYELLVGFSNIAKLREALRLCMGAMCKYCRADAKARGLPMECVHGCEALLKAKAALAEPPRNCDKVKTSWDVLKEWHEGLDTANDIVRMLDWLLAPATEKEGGAK